MLQLRLHLRQLLGGVHSLTLVDLPTNHPSTFPDRNKSALTHHPLHPHFPVDNRRGGGGAGWGVKGMCPDGSRRKPRQAGYRVPPPSTQLPKHQPPSPPTHPPCPCLSSPGSRALGDRFSPPSTAWEAAVGGNQQRFPPHSLELVPTDASNG